MTRCSSALRNGYSSLPRYFFASRSIWPSAPSVVSDARPSTAIHLYASFGSITTSEMRGSCSRFDGFARPYAVLKETSPFSWSTQTTVE